MTTQSRGTQSPGAKRVHGGMLDGEIPRLAAWAGAAAGSVPGPLVGSRDTGLYAGLTSAERLAARQAAAEAATDASARRSSLAGLTLRTAWEDAREVLVGVPADLLNGPDASLAAVFGRADRLRGLGVLALGLAVLVAAFSI